MTTTNVRAPAGACLCLLLAVACSRPQAAHQSGGDPKGAGAAASATTESTLRQQLLAALGGYENMVTRDQLLRLGTPEQLTPALAGIYQDASVHLAVRIQALSSLRFFPDARSRATLEQALTAADTADAARRAAVKAYATGFGAEAVPVLGRLLEHKELHTRNAAAKALGEIGTEPALAVLRRRLLDETDSMVKGTIQAQLGAAGGKPSR
jgi:HEAT repeat protein